LSLSVSTMMVSIESIEHPVNPELGKAEVIISSG
jgi:hypothetical protein